MSKDKFKNVKEDNIARYEYLDSLNIRDIKINKGEIIIYAFTNPVKDEIFYIGKTFHLYRRIRDHLRNKKITKLTCYLIHLANNHEYPNVEILDIIPENEWAFWEEYYISLYKSWGFKLMNGNNGGLGGGHKHTQETKDAIRLKMTGRPITDEFRELMSIIKTGIKPTKEALIKMSESRKGVTAGEKHPMYGKKHSEESKQKMSKSQRGCKRNFTPEGLKRIIEASKKAKFKKVLQYSLDGTFIKEWDSMISIQQELGFHASNISACCRGLVKKSHGFIWKLKEN